MSKPLPIEDVVKFKYPLAVIKKIELNYDDKGQCVDEIVTIVNKPQLSGRSFLEEPVQQQIPTLNNSSASGNWNNNLGNQSSQQWLSSNSYWTITPLNSILVESENLHRSRQTQRSEKIMQ